MDITVYKRDGSPFYWMKYYVDGNLQRESTKSSNLKVAKKIADKKRETLLENKGILDVDKLTVTDLLNELLADYEKNDMKSLDITKLKVEIIKDFFGKDRKLVNLTTSDILKYVDHRLEKQRKHSTINRELALIRRGFNLLIEHDKIKTAPKITLLNEDNVRQGFYEHWEYLKLLDEAALHIKPVVMFLYHSGWRRGEVLNLTWNMVDIDNGIVVLPVGKKVSKTGKGRTYYMPDNIFEMIKGLWAVYIQKVRQEVPTTEYVFTNREGTDKIRDFRAAWEGATKRAKLTGRLVHDFRRTAARNYIRAGVPQRVARDMIGHKTDSIFARYNIVSDQDIREAAMKQAAYLNGQNHIKPVEVQPDEVRDWETKIHFSEAKKSLEDLGQKGMKYLQEKYETVISVDEDDNISEHTK